MKGINNVKIDRNALVATMVLAAVFASNSAYADLNLTLGSANTFIATIGRTLNILAGLTGAYFVFNGIMTWKKSSSEHGGQQVEFKSVAIPIIAGSCLVAFATFVGAASSTFGFASTYTGI